MLVIEKHKEEIKKILNNQRVTYIALNSINNELLDGKSREANEVLIKLLEEYKEPIKLTLFEYAYLKVAKENEYNFIARDADDRLFLYSEQPNKLSLVWDGSNNYIRMFKQMFKFVKWHDEKPWNIDEILVNCEVAKDGNLD